MKQNKKTQRKKNLNLKSLREKKGDNIFRFILVTLFWLWSTSLIIGGSLLIGANLELNKASWLLTFGWILNLVLLIYCYWRKNE